MDLSQVDVGW